MKKIYSFLVAILISGLGFGQTTVTYDFSSGGAVTGLNQVSPGISVDSNIGFGSFKNSGTSNPIINNGQLRLYQNSSKGGSIVIYANNGVTITDITINASGTTGNAGYSVDGGSQTNLSAGTTYSINGINSTSEVEFFQRESGSSNRIYVDSFEVTYTQASSVANPDAFSASASSSTQIDLAYDDNAAGDNVIIVFDTDNTFTAPTGAPATVGNAFAGGTVLFNGSGSGTYNHTGLTENTTYYYAAYSYDSSEYSIGLNADTTTPCATPTNVSSFMITAGSESLDLSWTNESCFDEILVVAKAASSVTNTPTGDGTSYTANSTFGSGTDLGSNEYVVYKGTGTSETISGLTNNTTYHFTVFARKNTTWSSGVSNNETPVLSWCSPSPSSVDGDGITNVSFGTINNSTTTETNNYGDYSAQSTDVEQGDTVNLNITYETGFTYNTKIWIDFNNDGDFNDDGEEVYSGVSAGDDPTTLNTSFTIPMSTALGQYRLRIGGADSATPSPCYTGSYASYEDYTINVVAPSTNTEVEFASASATANEGDNTYQIALNITNADVMNATTVEVALTGGTGNAADINNFTTQSFTFPAGSSANQNATITITDDSDFEANETLVFTLQNVSGGNAASIGSQNSFTLTLENNDAQPPITLPYSEDFNACGTVEWTPFDEAGDDGWICDSGDYTMNGFSGSNDIDWLISDFRIDFDTYSNVAVNITTRERYGNNINENGEFEFLYSTDYSGTGDPTTATWTALTFNPNNTSSGGSYSNNSTTTVNISGVSGIGYLAFKYDMSVATNAEEWVLRTISIEAGKDADSDVDDSGSQPTASNIDSLVDTVAEAVNVFEIDIYDFGTSDGQPTNVTNIRLYPHSTNTAVWTNIIQGITLDDGNAITPQSVNITDSYIDIAITSGDLSIADGDLKTATIGVYLNTSNLADGSIISFMVDADNHGFTADNSGSGFATSFSGDFNSNNFTVAVDATELSFISQPTDVILNTAMSPEVQVAYTDANGNVDVDYDGSGFDISLTTSGSFDASATTTTTASNGIATFNNLVFDADGTNLTLTASDDSTFISGTYASDDTFDVNAVPSFLSEDFNDSNFTANPAWFGNTSNFTVITNSSIPSGNATTDGLYLASNSSQGDITLYIESTEVSEWEFSLASPSFSPSGSNNFGVVLMANAPFTGSLTATNFQGYYLRLGSSGSDDKLELWRKTGSGETRVGAFPSSPSLGSGALTNGLNIKITRNASGEFELFYSTGFTYDTEPTTSAGTLTDDNYDTSSYFGVFQEFANANAIRRVYFDNLKISLPSTTYTFDGTWSPSNPNGAATSVDNITITSGDATISSNTSANKVTVNAGASLTIDSSATLTVADVMTLESTSTSYASLILDGTISGTVKYERFVNSNTNGNDLIATPLSNESWSDFINSAENNNAATLLDNGGTNPTIYAFAPFDKTAMPSADYVNFDSNSTATITNGVGYRAATDAGASLTFTGAPQNGTISVAISESGVGFEAWNLIGNPYASYISAYDFLNHNINNNAVLDNASGAIYGYNAQNTNKWTIINLSTALSSDVLIAPGQGFFIASGVPSGNAQFTTDGTPSAPDMRRTNGSDDFIASRNSDPINYNLELTLTTASTNFNTDFYFNAMSSLGLDPGFDSQVFGGNAPGFAIYSHLVQDNTGIPMAIQSLGETDVTNTTVALGVNANQGEQVTFTISETTLPSSINVYLEDNVTNTFTLLNTSDYVLTPNVDLSGTGRFYLRFSNSVLSVTTNSFDNLNIYTNQSNRSIEIAGELANTTIAKVYDIQGRLIVSKPLATGLRLQTIDMTNVNTGVYIVELNNGNQNKTQKVILK